MERKKERKMKEKQNKKKERKKERKMKEKQNKKKERKKEKWKESEIKRKKERKKGGIAKRKEDIKCIEQTKRLSQ